MDDRLDLARRAVACPGWRLMPGVLTTDGERVITAHPNPAVFNVRAVRPDGSPAALRSPILPDFTDPATLSCLLMLVMERWGRDVHFRPFDTHTLDSGGVMVEVVWWGLAISNRLITIPRDPDGTGTRYLAGPTRAAALVAALEVPRV